MSDSPNLVLPYLADTQAQKHVTHNDALRILDAAVLLSVKTFQNNTPPGSPAEGDRHLTGAAPTGVWAGQANKIAAYQDAAWRFMIPKTGWRLWSEPDVKLRAYNGTSWTEVYGPAIQNLALLGVDTTADAANPLAVRGPNALFTAKYAGAGGSGDLSLKVNKETAADTASILFQTNFSGRAEFGLTGDDEWSVKTSTDGSSFVTALKASTTAVTVHLAAESSNAAGWRLASGAATATAPTLLPNKADTDSGMGWAAANQPNIIAGGAEIVRAMTDRVHLPKPIAAPLDSLARIYSYSNLVGLRHFGSATGAVRIDLPVDYADNMITMEIDIFDQSSISGSRVIVAGYANGGGFWGAPKANAIGAVPGNRVRLGRNTATGKLCVVIGETTTVWTSPIVALTRLNASFTYSGPADAFAGPYTIQFDSALSGITLGDVSLQTVVPWGIASTSTTTGSQIITGGQGISGNQYVGGLLDVAGNVQRSGTQLLTSRRTGWTAPTGTLSRGTFDPATVTTEQLAQRVKALIDDLTAHGLIGV